MKRIYFILILATLFVHKAYARDVNNPFYNAIDNQSFGLIESLIASGEDINMQDQSGKTALMHAAQKSSPDIVNFLINNGADVNVKTLNDVTALHYAARNKKSEIVRILIENGADIDGKDFSGFTPLMRAVTNNKFNNFEILLQSGSDPYIKNNNSKDSIDLVIAGEDKKMFGFLVAPLDESNRSDLIKIDQKLVLNPNRALDRVIDKKFTDISNDISTKISDYEADEIVFEISLDTEFANLPDYPCYKIINNDVSHNSCITVTDEMANRQRQDEVVIEALVEDELNSDLVVSEQIVSAEEVDIEIITPIDAQLASFPAVALNNEVVKSAAIAPKKISKLKRSPRKLSDDSVYTDLIHSHSINVDDITRDIGEVDFLALSKWAYSPENPTELIQYNLVHQFYSVDDGSQGSYKVNDEYLKEVSAQEKQTKLLAVTPVIKQSDKMKEPGFYIQSGSFIYPKNSTKLKKNLGKYGNVFIVERLVKKRNFHVVYVGPFKTKKQALNVSKKADFQKIIGTESIIRNF